MSVRVCVSPVLLLFHRIAHKRTQTLSSNARFLVFYISLSSTLVIFLLYCFFLCDVTFSADVLKANPSNFGAQITRVSSFLLLSVALLLSFVCPPL